MNSRTTKVLASAIIIGATLAAIVLTYKAHGAEPDTVIVPSLKLDTLPAKVAMTIERDGETVVSITLYGIDGQPSVIIHPDGNVDILRGTPEQAAKLFWHTVAHQLDECAKK